MWMSAWWTHRDPEYSCQLIDRAVSRLSAGAGVDATRRSSGGVERRAERFVVAQRLEVGIVARERTILRVERDGAFEMRDRFGVLVPLGVGDGEHVERVVVVGILVAHEAQVRERLVVRAAVDRERRRVEPLVDGLRRGSSGVAWRWQMFR